MIPQELTELKQWCIWRYVERGDKVTKLPINPADNTFAKSNDESTWADLQTAREGYQKYNADGLGFFFKEPYMGIDIDDIGEELERYKRGDIQENIVFEFYESLKSYTEISPSGNGIHIILKGEIPGSRRRKENVEMYDSGRFFTMTGDSLGKYETVNESNPLMIDHLYDRYIGENNVVNLPIDHHSSHNLSESEIISQILNSKQSDLFKRFMNDGWEELYDSQSEADLAFANLLAFWCARDYTKMDSLFRQSGLMREKWDEKRGKTTYGEATLHKAINETESVYTPKQQKETGRYTFSFDEPEKEEKTYPNRSWDDTGNADRVMDRYGDLIKYSYTNNKFYVYEGTQWIADDMGYVRQLIDATVTDMKNEKIYIADDVEEKDAMKAWNRHLSNSRNNSKKKAVQDELKHRVSISTNAFDKDDMLLNTQNGYLDLTDGEMHDHDKEKLFSRKTNTEYTDTMGAPVWENFLQDIFDGDQELIRYLQKAIGYSLTGSIKEQVMFILYGKGRNGKSLFINVLSDILGSYANNIQAKTLMVKHGETINNDLARLQGSRLVTSSEPNEGFRFDEGLIKQITGEETITARFLYGEEFEFLPKFKIWVTTNHKPIIRGTDDGIWRRMMLIPFSVQIPEEKMDKDLKWKLLREAPGILDWALEGAIMWQREGLEMPGAVEKASREYRREMDVLEQFIDEVCVVGESEQVAASDFYKAYKQWAKDNEEHLFAKQKFSQKMKEKFEYKKTRSGRFYRGIDIVHRYPGLANIK